MQISRLKNLQTSLKNPILIKKKENLFYLTGRSFDYRAEEYLLITMKNIVGFGSGLENMDWIKKSDRLKNIGQYLKGYKQLGIEYGFTYGEGEYLKYKISDLGYKILVKPERSVVDEMRQIKSAEELEKIRKSMEIVERVFGLVKKQLRSAGHRPAWTEEKLAKFITSAGFKLGAEDISFPAIVASGANAAIPHHVPSLRKLRAGESIIIDFGFKYQNYCSDFTRTVFLKKVPKNLEVAYNQVEKAYNGSMDFVSFRPNASESRNPGAYISGSRIALAKPPTSLKLRRTSRFSGMTKSITGNDVYQKSVDILAEKKLDKYFIHSLGHGTGLEIHELPNLSPKSKDVLKNGMVFSVEPGVYMPHLGGIRIEDLVYLENGKVKKFINVPTRLKDNII